jgi:NAD(P)H dehydrogenase (quinone)
MTAKIAVIYYSATGNVHIVANALTEGAEQAGAQVRLRRVAEPATDAEIDTMPAWRAHLESVRDAVQVATNDDLLWADAYAFGSPTRYGNIAWQLKRFLDSTGELWYEGHLSGKAVTAFASASNLQGGSEATLLALYNTMHHWGSIIVPPGYTDPVVRAAHGNPYGTSHPARTGPPGETTLAAARHQGARLASIAHLLCRPRVPDENRDVDARA